MTSCQYDLLGRLVAVTQSKPTTRYSYDKNGNLLGMIYPNGCKTVYSYDKWNSLIEETIQNPEGNELEHYEYTLAPTGNRVSVKETDGTTITYGYDKVYKLIQEEKTTIQYTYDAFGNIIKQTGTTENNIAIAVNNMIPQQVSICLKLQSVLCCL